MDWSIISILVSLLAFVVAAYFYYWVLKLPTENDKLKKVGSLIRKGSFTFLKKEYSILAIFVFVIAMFILFLFPEPLLKTKTPINNVYMTGAYVLGSVLSGLAGYIGISIATIANVKTATIAKKSLEKSFICGFRGGAVMGMAVVGTSLMGAAILYILTENPDVVLAFSFGASSLALFAKAGGGIFTKTADIAADLTGKVELGIPEDDPRNPAVIADNVGDNVGDVAGMGADLFDSNIAAIAATIIISLPLGQINLLFCFCALGLLSSIIGVLCSKIKKNGTPSQALNRGTYLTCALFAIFTLVATYYSKFDIRIWGATIVGMLIGVIIGVTSDYFTGDNKKPVKKVAESCQNGPAFTILSGFSYGLLSSMPALIGIGLASLISYKLCAPIGPGYEMLGISMSAIGMLSIVGMIISNDAYGPIVDNARGIAEMGNLGEEVIKRADELDAAGNTTKAITKGFAIGAAGLTVIALLAAFAKIVSTTTGEKLTFDIMNPAVFFGALVGVAIPAVFSAILIFGVNKNSQKLVKEIHRQFNETEGLKEGKVEPDYSKCINIATVGAIKELIPAGVISIIATLIVGFIGGVQSIGGFLTGNILSGLLLAMLMSNAGGLWDNAKKYIEAGNFGGKGSEAHKAAVIGDTIGDPFKDTAGPSINTQITVVSLVSSLAASLFMLYSIF
ncbi:MAG: sodium-translocating pyrophosphatase [Clostridia bacterium]|nr:sodium-translocating pyrophosphatase [Clostridia bacterium]